jgi:NADH:ubiquinone oxidoreductase subunit K
VTFNLIRALIGLELLIKAVTLLLILVGYVTGHEALAQSLVITLIVMEVVIIAVAAGIILGLHRHNKGLDVRHLRSLKG